MANIHPLANLLSHLLFLGLFALSVTIPQHSFNQAQAELGKDLETTPVSPIDSEQGSPTVTQSDPLTPLEGTAPTVKQALYTDVMTSTIPSPGSQEGMASKEGQAAGESPASGTPGERSSRPVGSRDQAGESQGKLASRERLSVFETLKPHSTPTEQASIGPKPTSSYPTGNTATGVTQLATTLDGSGSGDGPEEGLRRSLASSEGPMERTTTAEDDSKEQ
ncbi:uncharacterized protein LOC125289153 [Alosa alosa]|uniref:uncharacterized protein LOC125289153 n=1 Tax=Alosa alosa TaxID=278164 RepID=UPI0020153931|nr:uncharacterized protein LOC125289153 [Alosa alosa]